MTAIDRNECGSFSVNIPREVLGKVVDVGWNVSLRSIFDYSDILLSLVGYNVIHHSPIAYEFFEAAKGS